MQTNYTSLSLIAIISFFILVGCGDFDHNAATRKSITNTTTINVVWFNNDEQVSSACAKEGLTYKANGCAFGNTNNCTIYAVEPSSFRDDTRLQILGHETWHCLGAEHK